MREESVETSRLEAPAVATSSYDRIDRELGRWAGAQGWVRLAGREGSWQESCSRGAGLAGARLAWRLWRCPGVSRGGLQRCTLCAALCPPLLPPTSPPPLRLTPGCRCWTSRCCCPTACQPARPPSGACTQPCRARCSGVAWGARAKRTAAMRRRTRAARCGDQPGPACRWIRRATRCWPGQRLGPRSAVAANWASFVAVAPPMLHCQRVQRRIAT
jgi:hypothetical protein